MTTYKDYLSDYHHAVCGGGEGMEPGDVDNVPMTEAEWLDAEEYRLQSVAWVAVGRCAGCGAERPTETFPSDPTTLYCRRCMADFQTCIGDAQEGGAA